MVLQPHPLIFVCLTLVGFDLWLFCVLDVFDSCGFSMFLPYVDSHSFSHGMITHEPFVRFDGLLVSFSCGLG
jgi:hypothetical protein